MKIILLLLFSQLYLFSFTQQRVYDEAPHGYSSDFTAFNKYIGFDFTSLVEQTFMQQDTSSIGVFMEDTLLKKDLLSFYKKVQGVPAHSNWRIHGHYNASFGDISGSYDDFTKQCPERIYKNKLIIYQIEPGINTWMHIDYAFEMENNAIIIKAFSAKYLYNNFGDAPSKLAFNQSYPSGFDRFNEMSSQIFKPSTKYQSTIDYRLKSLAEFERRRDTTLGSLADMNQTFFYESMQSNLSFFYGRECGRLSWMALESKNYEAALNMAKKGLNYDPEQEWIKTNLALAYLLNDSYDEAIKIYDQLSDKLYVLYQKVYLEIFIEDIESLQKKSIQHDNLDKALLYLKGKQK
ncbi:tetratricopeptide repeat protein [Putridiphycobacter roseus]|nr:tetratricopeptide repeat protein [Putridiphycobacter roseus]